MAGEVLALGFMAMLDQALDDYESALKEAEQAGDEVEAMRCQQGLAELVALHRRVWADNCL